jgi:hypothetical protein
MRNCKLARSVEWKQAKQSEVRVEMARAQLWHERAAKQAAPRGRKWPKAGKFIAFSFSFLFTISNS